RFLTRRFGTFGSGALLLEFVVALALERAADVPLVFFGRAADVPLVFFGRAADVASVVFGRAADVPLVFFGRAAFGRATFFVADGALDAASASSGSTI